jgi:hypothetical protein
MAHISAGGMTLSGDEHSTADQDLYMPFCPRCWWFQMEERSESVTGAPWAYTHQCAHCGMGVNHSTWPSHDLQTLQDLHSVVSRVQDWASFADWVVDYTDGLVSVFEGAEGDLAEITMVSGTNGLVFRFPGDVRELTFDLQSCEDNALAAWGSFEGEAAARLVPLSIVYNDDLDEEAERMPEGWVRSEDGSWSLG